MSTGTMGRYVVAVDITVWRGARKGALFKKIIRYFSIKNLMVTQFTAQTGIAYLLSTPIKL